MLRVRTLAVPRVRAGAVARAGTGIVSRARTGAARAAAVLLLPALLAAPGCSSSGGGCRPTRLTAEPVTVSGPHATVTYSARLTSRGAPVPGQSVHFAVTTADGGGLPVGDARTDGDGRAVYVQPGGLAQRLMDGRRATGYEARFDVQPLPEKGNAGYCAIVTTARFTCAGAAACTAE